MNVGMLTAGGDSPGINALIRALFYIFKNEGIKFYGIYKGWDGLLNGDVREIKEDIVKDISNIGGTILKTTKNNILTVDGYREKIEETLKKFKLDVLIICGGFDTLKIANVLYSQSIPIIGIPQTIDNDIEGTDFSLGFFSAVKNIVTSLEIIRSTNQSHERDILVEIMGREAGWLTVFSAITKKVEGFFIPEIETSLQNIADTFIKRRKKGQNDNIVLISEGVKIKEIRRNDIKMDIYANYDFSGITLKIAEKLKDYMETKPKSVILSYIQRGGSPDIFDIVLATRFAYEVVKLVKKNKYGFCIGIKEDKIYSYDIKDATRNFRLVTDCYIKLAYEMVQS